MRCDKALKRLEKKKKKRKRDAFARTTYSMTHCPRTYPTVAAVAVIAITAFGSLLLRRRAAVEWRISR